LRAVDEECEIVSLHDHFKPVSGVQATVNRRVGNIGKNISEGAADDFGEAPFTIAVNLEQIIVTSACSPDDNAIEIGDWPADLFDIYADDAIADVANWRIT
jgi:hypothetical protein